VTADATARVPQLANSTSVLKATPHACLRALLAQTLWNFHDVSAIQIKQTAATQHLVTFVVNWYGEARADSDQLAGWQSRTDSCLYHHFIRQTWTITDEGRPVIQMLVAAGGDTPSPLQPND